MNLRHYELRGDGINEGFLNTYLRRRIPAFVDAVVDVAEQIYVRRDRQYSDDLILRIFETGQYLDQLEM
jgi:hypothetical protein